MSQDDEKRNLEWKREWNPEWTRARKMATFFRYFAVLIVAILAELSRWLCLLFFPTGLVCVIGSLFFGWRWQWLLWAVGGFVVFSVLRTWLRKNYQRMISELNRYMAAQDAKE